MDKLIFVYGSLRKGMYNYEWFKEGMEYVESHKIEGYRMYSLGAFPFVVEDEDSSIIVDVMKVNERTKERIDGMEHGAGYISKEITVGEHTGTLYVYSRERQAPVVESGDWVKFKTEE